MVAQPELAAEGFRTILEGLPTGVYLVGRDRRIIFWNDGCERITGFLRHEVIGRSCAQDLLMHCDERTDSIVRQCLSAPGNDARWAATRSPHISAASQWTTPPGTGPCRPDAG
jgi:PAS domain S-box-containing protein